MDALSLGNESDAEPISTHMLEDIRNGNQSQPSINMIGASYKMHDHT